MGLATDAPCIAATAASSFATAALRRGRGRGRGRSRGRAPHGGRVEPLGHVPFGINIVVPRVVPATASRVPPVPVPRPSRARAKEGSSVRKDCIVLYLVLGEDLVFWERVAPGGPCVGVLGYFGKGVTSAAAFPHMHFVYLGGPSAAWFATLCIAATAASPPAAVFHASSTLCIAATAASPPAAVLM